MKIEMGESLFYSWLRHVKECQVVQTNWKVSPQWNLQHEADIELLMQRVDEHFSAKYGYDVFKKNASMSQILQQGECDVVGVAIQDGSNNVYAVDVAFHEGGLNYGSKEVTVMKVIAKSVRTAMCLWGYMECKNAEIIFASPKINPAIMNDVVPCIDEVNHIFKELGYELKARLIANADFNDTVLQPILMVSDGVADTSCGLHRQYSTAFLCMVLLQTEVQTTQYSRSPVLPVNAVLTKPSLAHYRTGGRPVDNPVLYPALSYELTFQCTLLICNRGH